MDLATAVNTARRDTYAAVTAVTEMASAAATGIGEFAVEERTDPCFAELGGLSGEVRVVVEAVADVEAVAAIDGGGRLGAVVEAVAAAWEEQGYSVERAEAPELPAPLLFATASDGRKASLRFVVPRPDRPLRVRLGASSPCVPPDGDQPEAGST